MTTAMQLLTEEVMNLVIVAVLDLYLFRALKGIGFQSPHNVLHSCISTATLNVD